MKTAAAILTELGKPLTLTEIEIPSLKPGQVLVEILFSGVCYTQVLESRGKRGPDPFLPHCLGHEGSGIVQETGPGVTRVKPGDKVILSWIKASGADIPGTTYQWEGRTVNSGAITTFSRYSVLSENRVTPIVGDVSMNVAALMGCALPTGFGSVMNTAAPRPGQSLAVFGVGGVGASAVMAAHLSGCFPIIAVDINESKLEMARQFGATHAIVASGTVVQDILKIAPGGVDYAIEATGKPAVMAQALSSVRNQGGAAVIIGNAAAGEELKLDPKQFNLGKQLRGTWGGDAMPDRDFPRYCKLAAAGKLPVAPMTASVYSLEEVNKALDDLESGKVLRPMIDMRR